ERWLREQLAAHPIEARVVEENARQAGHSKATLRRAKIKIGVVSYAEGFGKNCQWMWDLPRDAHEALRPDEISTSGEPRDQGARDAHDEMSTSGKNDRVGARGAHLDTVESEMSTSEDDDAEAERRAIEDEGL